ncbi:MAG: DNA translocase FtsK [Pirellulaceae bacterium]
MTAEERQIEFDVEAILLSAICVFLWLSLLTFDPADQVGPLAGPFKQLLPVDTLVYPANAEIQNACGWFGALVAQLLLNGLGFGSYLLALGLTVLTVWMFRVQQNYVRASRQFGWVCILLAGTTFVSLVELPLPNSPIIGPGGYLGAVTSTWLNEHFAIVGSIIMTTALFFAGLLLSTDYVVMRMLGKLLLGSASVAGTVAKGTKGKVVLPGTLRRSRTPTTDVDEGIELGAEAEPSDVPVRIRGKHRDDNEVAASENVRPAVGLLGGLRSLAGAAFGPKATSSEAGNLAEEETDVEEYVEEDVPSAADPAEEYETEYEEAEEGAAEDESEYRELEADGEALHVRADQAHEELEVPLRIKTPKDKKQAQEASDSQESSLAYMDDTKLPAGTEEYVLPAIDLLLESDDVDFETQAVEVRRKAKILEKTFKDFGFNVRVVEIETGPVIAQYEVELEAGLRLSKITGLADDLAIALRVPSVRIVAPIPGKNTVGIEVPNETRQVVRMREVIEEMGSKGQKFKIPLYLGKDVSGNPLSADLASLPHLLIAGRTGTGKSVCLNTIIASILMTKRPDEVRMLMIDPKMVELSGYGRLPHLMHPVVTDMKKAEAILSWSVDKMEERYSLLARAGVRHISSYNELGREELLDRLRPETPEEAEQIPDHLPFIVIVADEMADLMMTAGKEVEQHIIRLAQKSRAVGIHLILATQKPTVDVITGLIKSNLPARISFQVASRTDSRVVLDEMGADKLLGNGDMLFLWPGTSMLLRGQGTYMSDEEINAVVDHCSTGEQNFVNELVNLKIVDEDGDDAAPGVLKKRDDIYAAAVDVVVREGRGSCSLLQRALGIGYGRAARLIDYMAEDAIVGQYNGSQARDVLISIADWEAMQSGADDDIPAPAKPAPAPPKNRNKIRMEEPGPVAKSSTPAPVKAPVEAAEDEELPWEEAEELAPEAAGQVEYEEAEEELEEEADEEQAEQEPTAECEEDEYEEEGEEYEEAEYEDDVEYVDADEEA